jgi:hypothetical protein
MEKIITKCVVLLNLIVIIICYTSINTFAVENEMNEDSNDEWSEISFDGRGIKFVNEYGTEIVKIDKFGGIYLNGDVYINNDKIDNSMSEELNENGFNFIILYAMLSVLLVLYVGSLFKEKLRGREYEQ